MKTFLMIKPDGYSEESIRFEFFSLIFKFGLKILYCVPQRFPQTFFEEFYYEHSGQHYYEEMILWLSLNQLMPIILEGNNAIQVARNEIVGRNNTGLRGKYNKNGLKNLAHASDSEESFKREFCVFKKHVPVNFL